MNAAALRRPAPIAAPRAAPAVALRESSIVTLYAAGVLDADQVAAAFRFRNDWEKLTRVQHPSRLFERIDYAQAIPEDALLKGEEARKDLKQARLLLGKHGFALLMRICGEGHHVRDLYQTRRARDTATDMLRIHLAALVEIWIEGAHAQD